MKRSYAVYQVDAFTKEKLSATPPGWCWTPGASPMRRCGASPGS